MKRPVGKNKLPPVRILVLVLYRIVTCTVDVLKSDIVVS